MPFIIALNNAGLSSSHSPLDADSFVPAGEKLAINWIKEIERDQLAKVSLAGAYTGPQGCAPLKVMEERYLNPSRFSIPNDAWIENQSETLSQQKKTQLLPVEVAQLNHYYEGCSLTAYPDAEVGYAKITIGWGSTFYQDGRPISIDDRLTQDQADALYDYNCYHTFWKKLLSTIPYWNEMTNQQRAALCSFAYNNGPHFFDHPNYETITRNLREKDWRAIPGTLMMYRNPNGPTEVGLGRRRRAEGLVWIGMIPKLATHQADVDINSPEDCARFEKSLKNKPPEPIVKTESGINTTAVLQRSLRLQDFLNTDLKYDFDAIANDEGLTHQIQIRLIDLGLLDPPLSYFGPITGAALRTFQDLMRSNEPNYLGKTTAKQLIETSIDELPRPKLNLDANDLATRVIRYMQKLNYTLFTGNKEKNIIYIEGMNKDGSLNNDEPNHFNDLRVVIEFLNGKPHITGSWEATTEPGEEYTLRPLRSVAHKGAARVKFGQYCAWKVGLHGKNQPHRALVQVRPITVHRDLNKDFLRTGDKEESDLFAINQHHGYDHPRSDIYTASAGCLVGRSSTGHAEFMRLIEEDPRYQANPKTFCFTSTIIDGKHFEQTIKS